MLVLEIAMLLVGLGAVIYSYRITEKNKPVETETVERGQYIEYTDFPEKEWNDRIVRFKEQAEDVYNEVDDKISKLSNEKIMGMTEYSDQVLDKIEKNHGEVVFLYDMMNEKREEIQKTISEVDSLRAGLKSEADSEYQKLLDQEDKLEQIRQDIQMEALAIKDKQKEIELLKEDVEKAAAAVEAASNELACKEKDWESRLEKMHREEQALPEEFFTKEEDILDVLPGKDAVRQETDREKQEEKKMNDLESEDAVSASDVFDAEIARIEEEEVKEKKEAASEAESLSEGGYVPLSQQKQPQNHNDEIIDLYKKGRSIIEISKMLSLGQGEVKFVIDLYNAS